MKEKETNEIVNPEVQLEIDSMVEEYEIELRKELDLSKANSYKEIEKKKRTFKARVIENELDDIRRDVKEIRDEEKSIIGINFWISLFVTVLVMIFAFSAGEDLADFAQWIAGFVTKYLNWFYVLVASGFLIFLLFLASGRFGSVVLGHPDERPEFSNFSWYSMLFSAGMGVGILFYGSAEPMSHFLNSPVDPSGSAAAATSAMTYSAFHWGLHAWGIYTVCAVGIAYYGFRKRKRYLVSSSILNFTSNKKLQTVVKSTTDLISILAVIFGVSTSLGVGVLQISKGLNHVFDMETSNFMGYAVIISIITLVFIISSSTGLKKGIRILSNLNMIIAIL